MATQPPVLYLAFLHLIFFLLFIPAWGSLLHRSLLQGVLPLPGPHFLWGQGMGPVSSATLQTAPSPGDTPSTGAATQEVPASEQTAPPGPSAPGEHSADSPEQKAKRAPERGDVLGSGATERPSARTAECQDCRTQVPSRAPLCSARARAAIAFLHLYWKVEEVASGNRGNWVIFQLALNSQDCLWLSLSLPPPFQRPLACLHSICAHPAGLACRPPAQYPCAL